MQPLHKQKTLTKAEDTWHRNEVFPGDKNPLLKVTLNQFPTLDGF